MHPALTRTLRLVGLLEPGRRVETRVRMRQARALPDALIIGAQKCGTSSLHNYLTQHPGVIAPLRKEVHYFDDNYRRGERWYRAHFGRAGGPGINLDSSPYYLFHPLAAQRAHQLLPDARLIVMLRDPVRRAYSHYWHERDKGRETLSFADALDAEQQRIVRDADRLARGAIDSSLDHRRHGYVARGRYAEQLECWLAFYPARQLRVVRFESFVREPLSTLNETLAFLGLAPMARARVEPRNARKYPPLDPATVARLQAYFEPHNRRLEALLGQSMGW
jgi:hypothetical protein